MSAYALTLNMSSAALFALLWKEALGVFIEGQ